MDEDITQFTPDGTAVHTTSDATLPIGDHGEYHSFRAELAKRLVRRNIVEFWQSRPDDDLAWKRLFQPVPGGTSKEEIDSVKSTITVEDIPHVLGPTAPDTDPSPFTVCIIGAGVAGLFTAMTIDYLNAQVSGLDMQYEILEAADKKRFGGRLYTHKFSDDLHDYYDVGAMRFPKITIMDRTFDLLKNVLKFEEVAQPETNKPSVKVSKSGPVKLVPYYLKGVKCPYYYNDLQYPDTPKDKKDPTKPKMDPFRVQSKRKDEEIPEKYLKLGTGGPGEALLAVIEPFKEALRKDLESKPPTETGWEKLMAVDKYSVRQFLARGKDDIVDGIAGPGYNFRTIEWMETFGSGTLNYDESFAEVVLGSLDFDYYSGKPGKSVEWRCVEGGAQLIAEGMRATLKQGDVKFESRVTKIKRDWKTKGHNKMIVRVGPPMDNEADEDRRHYAAVFCSTTLAAMQRMDLTSAVINYGAKLAIRALRYGVSCKIGIKFKEAWWIKDFGIDCGGVSSTDRSLRVCVYPSYNIRDDEDKAAVLLCSYTWGQDAQRLSALISRGTPEADEELKEIIFQDLALLHSKQQRGHKHTPTYQALYKRIKSLYVVHHAYDWGDDKNMSGAFAHFGPGQFSKMYPDLIEPQGGGRLFIIGEAASKHHAWVVGALESAVRGVYQLLQEYRRVNDKVALEAMAILENSKNSPYGPVPYEESREIVAHQVAISKAREESKRDVPRD
ncbi:hypothetical protein MMC11_006723 [Xylographa trunciseda]|nr:hypothetical protein [Xylographa trunciseda]